MAGIDTGNYGNIPPTDWMAGGGPVKKKKPMANNGEEKAKKDYFKMLEKLYELEKQLKSVEKQLKSPNISKEKKLELESLLKSLIENIKAIKQLRDMPPLPKFRFQLPFVRF